MARRSQWRLCTLSATLIVLLRAGWTAVMTVVLQNGSTRQLAPRELAELNGEAPAHPGRQSRPGHDRRRKSLLHGASRPSGSTPATRPGRAAASPPTGVPLQTFQRGWFENLIKAHKLHLASDRTSCRKATANQFPPADPHCRLLAAAEPAHPGTPHLLLARGAVRHDPALPDQDRRARHRDGHPYQGRPAKCLPLSSRIRQSRRPYCQAAAVNDG